MPRLCQPPPPAPAGEQQGGCVTAPASRPPAAPSPCPCSVTFLTEGGSEARAGLLGPHSHLLSEEVLRTTLRPPRGLIQGAVPFRRRLEPWSPSVPFFAYTSAAPPARSLFHVPRTEVPLSTRYDCVDRTDGFSAGTREDSRRTDLGLSLSQPLSRLWGPGESSQPL